MSGAIGGWNPFGAAGWPGTAASLTKSGDKWEDDAVIHDLRWHVDQGRKIPGRPALTRRWNWTDFEVKLLLANETRWWDPKKDRRAYAAIRTLMSERRAVKRASRQSPPVPASPNQSEPVHASPATQDPPSSMVDHQSPPVPASPNQSPPVDLHRRDDPPSHSPSRMKKEIAREPDPPDNGFAFAGSAALETAACEQLSEAGRMNPLLLPGKRRIWAIAKQGATVDDFGRLLDWRDGAPDAEMERQHWGRDWDSLLSVAKGWGRILAARRWDADGRPGLDARAGPRARNVRSNVIAQAAEYLEELREQERLETEGK